MCFGFVVVFLEGCEVARVGMIFVTIKVGGWKVLVFAVVFLEGCGVVSVGITFVTIQVSGWKVLVSGRTIRGTILQGFEVLICWTIKRCFWDKEKD